MAQHYVSQSALSEFRKCRRCFWLDRNKKIKRPRGAFPTLPGGMDRALKAYFDMHRAAGTLPAEIEGKVPEGMCLFPDIAQLKAMRDARRPLLSRVIGNVKLVGGIDDLLVDGVSVAPLDYKTKGSAIKDDADPFEYYRMQLNDYGLLLSAFFNGRLTGKAYLAYWSPAYVFVDEAEQHRSPGANLTEVIMECQVFSMDLDLEAARAEVIAAGVCLDGELPEASPECETCAFVAAHVMAVGTTG